MCPPNVLIDSELEVLSPAADSHIVGRRISLDGWPRCRGC